MTAGPSDAPAADHAPAAGPPTPVDRTVVEVDLRSIVTLLIVALAALALLEILQQTPGMVTKIVVGIVLALALDPVVARMRDRLGGSSRGIAVAIVGTGLGLALLGVLLVLGPAAIDQAGSLRTDLPTTIEDAYTWPVVGDRIAEADLSQRVEDTIDRLPAELDDEQITRYAEDLLGGLLTTVVVLVTAVAVMLDGEAMVQRIRDLFTGERRDHLDAVGRVVYRTFGNYFAGSLFVAILNGLVMLTAALALGVPLAPLAGLWSTLTNLIPQIGGFLGGSFLVTLALTQGPVAALIALVFFLVYQNLENNIIQPAVVGKAVDLTPPTTMLAALLGGAVAGVPGALIATPIVGVAKVLYLRDVQDGSLAGESEIDVGHTQVGAFRRVLSRIRSRADGRGDP